MGPTSPAENHIQTGLLYDHPARLSDEVCLNLRNGIYGMHWDDPTVGDNGRADTDSRVLTVHDGKGVPVTEAVDVFIVCEGKVKATIGAAGDALDGEAGGGTDGTAFVKARTNTSGVLDIDFTSGDASADQNNVQVYISFVDPTIKVLPLVAHSARLDLTFAA